MDTWSTQTGRYTSTSTGVSDNWYLSRPASDILNYPMQWCRFSFTTATSAVELPASTWIDVSSFDHVSVFADFSLQDNADTATIRVRQGWDYTATQFGTSDGIGEEAFPWRCMPTIPDTSGATSYSLSSAVECSWADYEVFGKQFIKVTLEQPVNSGSNEFRFVISGKRRV